ncbi:hypothetical protein SCORR_v1c04380 [Spiroplasma corruscae]|uniref:Transmembrane protein n=1 Tax=Spiroplasma corruscae TaxID=216934 RepID=A0A222EP08_9MOLU|nr:hypothetical protein [Spiroplasma corruscae]ASP28212.1 hypothetical protein SCORR_v1c04380 [Spiroplasma corruscae]
MNKEVNIIKSKTKKILAISILLIILAIIGMTVSVIYYNKYGQMYILFLIFVFLIVSICFLLSLIGGITFLVKNKKLDQLKKIKAKTALEWGIFYFKVLSIIDNVTNKNIKLNKGDKYEG